VREEPARTDRVEPDGSLVTLTHATYALHAASLLTGIIGAATVMAALLTGWLCRRLLGRPASESGRLCHGDAGHECGDCRRRVRMLPTLTDVSRIS
jgi:hypothetical protein